MTLEEERVLEWLGRMHILDDPEVGDQCKQDIKAWMEQIRRAERTKVHMLMDALTDPRIRAKIIIDITSASPLVQGMQGD